MYAKIVNLNFIDYRFLIKIRCFKLIIKNIRILKSLKSIKIFNYSNKIEI
jgi:hypothetical protein